MPKAFQPGLHVWAWATPWGRHGFDGIVCGKEACRGVGTRNRLQKHNC